MRTEEIPLPLRICVELQHYCTQCTKTQDLRPPEIKDRLRLFFTDAEVEQSTDIICGRITTLEQLLERRLEDLNEESNETGRR